jgi:DNA-binding GntR family transcriptional regulator
MNRETAPLLSAYAEIVDALICADRDKYLQLKDKIHEVLHAVSRYEHGLQMMQSNMEGEISRLLVDVMMGDHK